MTHDTDFRSVIIFLKCPTSPPLGDIKQIFTILLKAPLYQGQDGSGRKSAWYAFNPKTALIYGIPYVTYTHKAFHIINMADPATVRAISEGIGDQRLQVIFDHAYKVVQKVTLAPSYTLISVSRCVIRTHRSHGDDTSPCVTHQSLDLVM